MDFFLFKKINKRIDTDNIWDLFCKIRFCFGKDHRTQEWKMNWVTNLFFRFFELIFNFRGSIVFFFYQKFKHV